MATSTVAAFRAAYAEFGAADYPDTNVQAALDAATTLWASHVDGIHAATAHLLSLQAEQTASTDNGAGVLDLQRKGSLTEEFQTMVSAGNQSDAFWVRSAYGRMFVMFRNASTSRLPRAFF